ncbi:hypothetical protein [Falsibacillus pallidus]|uniref:hypothetical protein n=1 Tax=Falsibacillus pallidus TaxID=493781 RepID=UPI003D976376
MVKKAAGAIIFALLVLFVYDRVTALDDPPRDTFPYDISYKDIQAKIQSNDSKFLQIRDAKVEIMVSKESNLQSDIHYTYWIVNKSNKPISFRDRAFLGDEMQPFLVSKGYIGGFSKDKFVTLEPNEKMGVNALVTIRSYKKLSQDQRDSVDRFKNILYVEFAYKGHGPEYLRVEL